MANNISTLPKDQCSGCRACSDCCPKGCISFEKDIEGFFYPRVDESICISCTACSKNCPALNPKLNDAPEKAIAAYAKEKYSKYAGSSGGIFGLLASSIINNGGKVWGAAFDKNLKLRHSCATTMDGLKPLMRSKYIQSNTDGCFSMIKKDLKDGIPTLFAGTPCQVNALLNVIGNKRDKLTTIEVVCHGVPSQYLFDKSIEWWEIKHRARVKNFTFRSKHVGAKHPQAYSMEYACGGKDYTENGLHYQFPYYFGFQKYITLRPSCYKCIWARPQRCADITLADFWGIEKYDNKLNAKSGVSAVLINTESGKKLFDKIHGDIIQKQFPIEYIIENNGCLKNPTKLKPERTAFFEDLSNKSFDDIVKLYLTPRRKWLFDLYYHIPNPLRKILRKIMDKRMKYE